MPRRQAKIPDYAMTKGMAVHRWWSWPQSEQTDQKLRRRGISRLTRWPQLIHGRHLQIAIRWNSAAWFSTRMDKSLRAAI